MQHSLLGKIINEQVEVQCMLCASSIASMIGN